MIFKRPGQINTPQVVKTVMQTIRERDVAAIVVASSSGNTALEFLNSEGVPVVCVGYSYGFSRPGENRMTQKAREKLSEAGISVLHTAHILSGAERGLSNRMGGIYPVEIMAHTLRMFGQGVKVCVEISTMALDAGLIPYGKPILAVGGSGRGADTAVLITPAHANNILDTRIHEVLCKPGLYESVDPRED